MYYFKPKLIFQTHQTLVKALIPYSCLCWCLLYVVIIHCLPCIVVAHYSPCIIAICSTLSIHLALPYVAIVRFSPCVSIVDSWHYITTICSLLYNDDFCSSPCVAATIHSSPYIVIVHSLPCVINVPSFPCVVDARSSPCVVVNNCLFIEMMYPPPSHHVQVLKFEAWGVILGK